MSIAAQLTTFAPFSAQVRLGTPAHADNADEGRAPQAVADAATAAGLTDLAALLGDEGFGVRTLFS